jgi:eukaryotic-like serine/threonine-protein kinase
VEMVADHVWLPCRVVPADGRSVGRRIGPDGPCTAAVWSPDGHSVYLSSASSGTVRIWRQGFPDGVPEQITDGSTEEDGIAPDPDGESLLTSVGNRARSVWIHDATGPAREISGEGYAFLPMFPHSVSQPFSSDSRRVFYLVRKRRIHFHGAAERSGELWMTDLTTLDKESVLPGREVTSYDLSRDGQRIVFAALDDAGKSHLWLARLDRGAPPKQLSSLEADSPRFDPSGDIFYRVAEGPSQLGFIYRMAADGGNPQKVVEAPIMYFSSVSPDGAWLVATVAVTGDDSSIAVVAFAASTGKPVPVCVSCAVDWTPGPGTKSFVVRFGSDDQTSFGGETFVIALKPGQMLPALPAEGIRSESTLTKDIPGFREIPGFVYPSENTSVYAEVRGTIRRNIFRVPLRQEWAARARSDMPWRK